jgi:hypothetical protein
MILVNDDNANFYLWWFTSYFQARVLLRLFSKRELHILNNVLINTVLKVSMTCIHQLIDCIGVIFKIFNQFLKFLT